MSRRLALTLLSTLAPSLGRLEVPYTLEGDLAVAR